MAAFGFVVIILLRFALKNIKNLNIIIVTKITLILGALLITVSGI